MNYLDYFNLSQVSVIKDESIYRTELNSHVYSIPALRFNNFIGELTINNIVVTGVLNEPLHYHKTNIIALVTYGRGRIFSFLEKEGLRKSDDISIGDIVIIPKGILHAFESNLNETATYAVLEMGEHIDYQKHFYNN